MNITLVMLNKSRFSRHPYKTAWCFTYALLDTAFDLCVAPLHPFMILHLSAVPGGQTQWSRWRTGRAICSSTYTSRAQLVRLLVSVFPPETSLRTSTASPGLHTVRQKLTVGSCPESIGIAFWKWLKEQQHFFLNTKLQLRRFSSGKKVIHEDSLVRNRGKKSHVGEENKAPFQEHYCLCNYKPRVYKTIKEKLKLALTDTD